MVDIQSKANQKNIYNSISKFILIYKKKEKYNDLFLYSTSFLFIQICILVLCFCDIRANLKLLIRFDCRGWRDFSPSISLRNHFSLKLFTPCYR